MRVIGIIALALAVHTAGIAQNSKVVSAYNYLRYYNQDNNPKDLMDAKENIDAAATNEASMGNAKTWYYRGKIYQAMHISKDEQIKQLHENPISEAYTSYIKAKEIGSKRIDIADLNRNLKITGSIMFQKGVDYYNEKKYKKAVEMFENSFEVNKSFDIYDTLAIQNIALAAENGEMYDVAIEKNQKLMDIGFGGPTTYLKTANIYKKQGNNDKYMEYLKKGREKYPDDQGLITEEINIYLSGDNPEKAMASLDQAVKNDPTNKTLFLARGNLHEKNENAELAILDYKKAIEIDGEYFDANYNLGALYYNEGAEFIKQANELPLNENKKYQSFIEQANTKFKTAEPYLEKAHAVNPEDQSTMISLKEIYARTKQTEKYKSINEKMKN